jgi:hypothetical protein
LISNPLVNKKFLLTSIVAVVGLMVAISVGLLLPGLHTGDSTSTSSKAIATAQEEKSIVPLDQMVSGGPPRDGIPSIDDPKFTTVQEADKILEDSELVLGLNINGDIRAYPLQILVWHEIVNDRVGR